MTPRDELDRRMLEYWEQRRLDPDWEPMDLPPRNRPPDGAEPDPDQ